MKHTKKLISLLLALSMVLCLGVTALADDGETTLPVTNFPPGACIPTPCPKQATTGSRHGARRAAM